MKLQSKNIFKWVFTLCITGLSLSSCDKYLDRAPLDQVTPEDFLNTEEDLATYTLSQYSFPTHGGWGIGTFANDNHTDNQATSGAATRWMPGEWRVATSGGDWEFTGIHQINYFLENVIPKWKNNSIAGNSENINHYIGEAYFLRAYQYFNKVQALGDFPIVKNTLKDDMQSLTEVSIRRPRNEVARFILSDLDSAINLLSNVSPNGKRRLSKNAALLFKSRVALHEGTWLKYHAGTAFVPGGQGWPGAASNAGFSLDVEQEARYFLEQAKDAAQIVADAVPLTVNNKDDGYNSNDNPYFKMFGDPNLESYDEVLLWRSYDAGLGLAHAVNHYINRNGGNSGYTRGLVESFTMNNGLPIYAAGSGYHGDDYIQDVQQDRDNRLQLFMKKPGDLLYTDRTAPDGSPLEEGYPDIIGLNETKYVTGYGIKKGLSYVFNYSEGITSITGSIVFRAVEAYLNYIEASYLLSGSLDGKATTYWTLIRERAGVDPDFNKTIAATNMTEEAKRDFAAYSAGQLLTDKTLFNIRRERRLELIAEGHRFADLKRWRALDQLETNPYIIEGMKLWGPMQDWYDDEDGNTRLIQPGGSQTANVSAQSDSPYLRPYRINTASTNQVLNGYKWISAHYLSPIAANHFSITAENGNPQNSVIYQNPGWGRIANEGPTN